MGISCRVFPRGMVRLRELPLSLSILAGFGGAVLMMRE